jgi:hypothetical protein
MKQSLKLSIARSRRRRLILPMNILRVYCPSCAREVELISKAEAAGILEVDELALNGLLADGYIHTMQTLSGGLRVCKDSLFRRADLLVRQDNSLPD